MLLRTRSPSRRGNPPARRAGFTLVEVLLAGAIVAIAVVGAVGSIASTANLGRTNEETTRAYQAARRKLEELFAADASRVLALYDDEPADDPDGPGTAPGPSFSVAGLSARADDPDGAVGRVLFPTDPAQPAVLREDHVDASFGMPRDLTADGEIDAEDHASDYFVLPVRVRLEWRGISGDRTFDVDTVLIAR